MRSSRRVSGPVRDADVDAFLDEICVIAEIAADLPAIPRTSRDPDDDHVIAAALATGAECIVTGDDDLLVLGQHEGIVILSVRAFLERLGGTYP